MGTDKWSKETWGGGEGIWTSSVWLAGCERIVKWKYKCTKSLVFCYKCTKSLVF